MKIVCIGDSVTAGQLIPLHQGWTSLVAQRLPEHTIVNKGVNNDTTRRALERFPKDVQAERPDLVVIQFGHNDCNRWATDHRVTRVSLWAFQANLEEMVERCEAFAVKEVVFLAPYPTRLPGEYERDRQGYELAVLGMSRQGVSAFTPNPGVGGLLDDGIHLSVWGHRAYAAQVRSWLRP